MFFGSEPDRVFVICLVLDLEITCIYTGECYQVDFHERDNKYEEAMKEIRKDWKYDEGVWRKI